MHVSSGFAGVCLHGGSMRKLALQLLVPKLSINALTEELSSLFPLCHLGRNFRADDTSEEEEAAHFFPRNFTEPIQAIKCQDTSESSKGWAGQEEMNMHCVHYAWTDKKPSHERKVDLCYMSGKPGQRSPVCSQGRNRHRQLMQWHRSVPAQGWNTHGQRLQIVW